MTKLKFLDENPKRQQNLDAIIAAANDVISRISDDDLAKFLGRKVDLENGDAVQVRVHGAVLISIGQQALRANYIYYQTYL